MRGRGHNSGAGLLGQAPGYGAPVNRPMQGGRGLLASGLGRSRIQQQQHQQQQRPSFGATEYRRGVTRPAQGQQRGILLEQPEIYGQESYTEQLVEEDYYGSNVDEGGYVEEQGGYTEQQTEYLEEPEYDTQESYGQEAVDVGEQQYYDYGHGHNLNQPKSHRGLLEEPAVSRGRLLDQPRSLPDRGGWRGQGEEYERQEARALLSKMQEPVDYPRQQRSLLGLPREEGVGVNRLRGQAAQRSPNRVKAPEMDPPVMPKALIGGERSNFEEISRQRGLNVGREGRGLMDLPERGFVDTHREGIMNPPRERGVLDPARGGRSLMDAPRDQRGLLDPPRGLLDPPRQNRDQGMGLVESSWDETGVMDLPREKRGLMDRPRENQALMESPREGRGLMHPPGNSRGLLATPKQQSGPIQVNRPGARQEGRLGARQEDKQGSRQAGQPGARQGGSPRQEPRPARQGASPGSRPENPSGSRQGARQGGSPAARQESRLGTRQGLNSRLETRPGTRPEARGQQEQGQNRRGRNQRPGKSQGDRSHDLQLELMEKAGLQMKLLEEQQQQAQREEMERMTLLQQQQALLMQQQQQHLQQIQQQQQLQMLQEQQLYQQQQEAKLLLSGAQERNIPSIFEVPTKGPLGKRRGGLPSPVDNKRPRTRPEDRERRIKQDKRPSWFPGERQKQRQRERNREWTRNKGRTSARQSSPSNNKRDKKDSASDSSRSSSSKAASKKSDKDRRDVKKEKDKTSDKEGATTATSIDLTDDDKYDPAKPTPDDEDIVQATSRTDDTDAKKVETKDDKKSGEKKKEASEGKKETNGEETKDEVKKIETKKEESEKMEAENDEKKTEEKDVKSREISLTVTVNKKGRSVADGDKKEELSPSKQKKYRCNVCAVDCYDEESFARHMNGKKHKEKMQLVMTSTSHQALLIKTRMQAEEHLRQIENKKNSPGADRTTDVKSKVLETHCKTCDKMYTGAYKVHKESPAHKAREDRSKKGCKICNVTSFNTFMDFTKHLQSDWHRKNKRKLQIEEEEDDFGDLVTLDEVGFEEDSVAAPEQKEVNTELDASFVKPLPPGTEQATSTPKANSKPPKLEDGALSVTSKAEDETLPEKHDPNLAVGQKYIVQVSGYFCKLCSKFYINESSARVSHCQSLAHFDKLKKALAAKALSKLKTTGDLSVKTTGDLMVNTKEASGKVEKSVSPSKSAESVTRQNKTVEGGDNQSTAVEDTNQSADPYKMEMSINLTSESETLDNVQPKKKVNETSEITVKEGAGKNSMVVEAEGEQNNQVIEIENEKSLDVKQNEEDNSMDVDEGGEENGQVEEKNSEEGKEEKGQEDAEGDQEKSQEGGELWEGFVSGKSVRGKQQKARRGGTPRGRRGKKN